MRDSKRRRLESRGWKVGAASEFLGLSADEALFVELKVALSRLLKTVRRDSKLTQTDLANLVESSQSRVAKMESGDPSVSVDLLVRALLALGATAKELGQVISRIAVEAPQPPDKLSRDASKSHRVATKKSRSRERAA